MTKLQEFLDADWYTSDCIRTIFHRFRTPEDVICNTFWKELDVIGVKKCGEQYHSVRRRYGRDEVRRIREGRMDADVVRRGRDADRQAIRSLVSRRRRRGDYD